MKIETIKRSKSGMLQYSDSSCFVWFSIGSAAEMLLNAYMSFAHDGSWVSSVSAEEMYDRNHLSLRVRMAMRFDMGKLGNHPLCQLALLSLAHI